MDIKPSLEFDRAHIWHPYTQMKDYENTAPLFIWRAEGVKLFDAAGNYYYDTISSWWCNLLGHNVAEIKDAVSRQINELEHTLFAGITHQPAIDCAERLINLAGRGLDYVFFSDNGSTAVEIALKMSYQYWKNIGDRKRELFLFLEHGYHGDTIGAMSVSGVSQFNNVFKGLFFKSMGMPSPAVDMEKSLDILRQTLTKKGDSIAAIIIEPIIQCAGGMLIYKSEFLNELNRLAERYGFHIIADEIATGFGRTGRIFAIDWADMRPDFLCLSKALTNGTMPFAATLATKDIYNAFYDDYEKGKTFFHGHTFTANPIGCAAATATIDKLLSMDWQGCVSGIEEFYKKDIADVVQSLPFVENFRHIGAICAFELRCPDHIGRAGWQLYNIGLRHHLILRPLGNTVYLFLPIVVNSAELQEIKAHLQAALEEFSRLF